MDIKTINQRIIETENKISLLSKQTLNKKNSMKTTQFYTQIYKQLHILENKLQGLQRLKKKLDK